MGTEPVSKVQSKQAMTSARDLIQSRLAEARRPQKPVDRAKAESNSGAVVHTLRNTVSDARAGSSRSGLSQYLGQSAFHDVQARRVGFTAPAQVDGGLTPAEQAAEIRQDVDDGRTGDAIDTLGMLSGPYADEVVAILKGNGTLDKIGQHLTKNAQSAQTDHFFQNVAGSWSGGTLASLSMSIGNYMDQSANVDPVFGMVAQDKLGRAIADSASADTRLSFVEGMAPAVGAADSNMAHYAMHAMEEVFVSLENHPQQAGKAFDALRATPEGLRMLMVASVHRSWSITPGYSAEQMFRQDPISTNSIVTMANAQNDPTLNAELFVATSDTLSNRRSYYSTDATAPMQATALENAGLKLIQNDTTGVMETLALNKQYGDYDGESFINYTAHMFEAGRGDKLIPIQTALMTGNDGTTNPSQRFGTANANGEFVNAEVMGYFAGGATAGLRRSELSDNDKGEFFMKLFNSVSEITATPVDNIIAIFADGGASVPKFDDDAAFEAWVNVFIPTDGNGTVTNQPARDAFDQGYERLEDQD